MLPSSNEKICLNYIFIYIANVLPIYVKTLVLVELKCLLKSSLYLIILYLSCIFKLIYLRTSTKQTIFIFVSKIKNISVFLDILRL